MFPFPFPSGSGFPSAFPPQAPPPIVMSQQQQQQAASIGKKVPGLDMSVGMGQFFMGLLLKRVQSVTSFSEFLDAISKCKGLTVAETANWNTLQAVIKSTILIDYDDGVDLRSRPFVRAYAALTEPWAQCIVDQDVKTLPELMTNTCKEAKENSVPDRDATETKWNEILCDFFSDLALKWTKFSEDEHMAIMDHLNVLRKLNGFASVIGDRMVEYKRVTDHMKQLAQQRGIDPDAKNPDSMMRFGMFTIELLNGKGAIKEEMENSFVTPEELNKLLKIDRLRPTGTPEEKDTTSQTTAGSGDPFMNMLAQFGPPASQGPASFGGMDSFMSGMPGLFPPSGATPPPFPFPQFGQMMPGMFPPPLSQSTGAAPPFPDFTSMMSAGPSVPTTPTMPSTMDPSKEKRPVVPEMPIDPDKFMAQMTQMLGLPPKRPAPANTTATKSTSKQPTPKQTTAPKGRVAALQAEAQKPQMADVKLAMSKLLPPVRKVVNPKSESKTKDKEKEKDKPTEKAKEKEKESKTKPALSTLVQEFVTEVLGVSNVDVSSLSDEVIRKMTYDQWMSQLEDPFKVASMLTYLINPMPVATTDFSGVKQMIAIMSASRPPTTRSATTPTLAGKTTIDSSAPSPPIPTPPPTPSIPATAPVPSATSTTTPSTAAIKAADIAVEPKPLVPTSAPTPAPLTPTPFSFPPMTSKQDVPIAPSPPSFTFEPLASTSGSIGTDCSFTFDFTLAEKRDVAPGKSQEKQDSKEKEKEKKKEDKEISPDELSAQISQLSVQLVAAKSLVLTTPPSTKAGAAALDRLARTKSASPSFNPSPTSGRVESDRPTKKRQTTTSLDQLKASVDEDEEAEEEQQEDEEEANREPFVFELNPNMNFGGSS